MPSIIQRAFSAGELAPSLYARADIDLYRRGLHTLRNFIIRRAGGATNRAGLQFLGEVRNSAARTYLFPFVFSRNQTYIIEAGVEYFRIWQNGVLQKVTGAIAWSPLEVYIRGDIVVRANSNYLAFQASFNKDPFTEPTFWYRMPESDIYEIPTDYTQEELPGLKHVQSNDVMTFVHKNSDISELRRTVTVSGDLRWRFDTIVFGPTIPAPSTGLTLTPGVAGSVVWRYQVTAVKTESYEESIASAVVEAAAGDPTATAPHVLAWDAVLGAVEYNVYREVTPGNGVYAFIGVAANATFNDPKIQPDESSTPPLPRDPFSQILDKPGAVTYSEQRLVFAGSYNHPEGVEMSRTAKFHNFTISSPLQDDDAIAATLAGRTFNEIRHLLEMGNLIVFAVGGEWVFRGNADGIMTPTQPLNVKQGSAYGASDVAPVAVGDNVVFVQARGNIVRNLHFDQNADGYTGSDITIAANHLFEGFNIERMDYAAAPFSLVGAVRSDGVLLSLSYLPEEETFGWSRLDTDGSFEEFCVIPEGDEDAMYVIVRRRIGALERRYIERFASRRVKDVAADSKFLDSFLTYDGRNWAPGTTMTLTSTTGGWTHHDLLQLDSSPDFFTAGEAGNIIVLRSTTAEVRISIATVISESQALGYPDHDVPLSLQGVAAVAWDRAVDRFGGLGHLEGKTVHILAEGNVVTPRFVVNGEFTLGHCYTVLHAGLPYVCDFETLDIDVDDLRDRKKNLRSVSLIVEASRGFSIGPDADHLVESMPAHTIEAWHEPPRVMTELVEVDIQSTWEETGRFFLRHIEPLPLTINGAIPRIDAGG